MKEKLALREEFDHKLVFESFGARILLESGSEELLEKAIERARKALLGHVRIIEKSEPNIDYRFGFGIDEDGLCVLFENSEKTKSRGSEFAFFWYFDAMIRLRVAENAVDRVFVHAGVVGWRGRAVMVPAGSHKGKTTLVAELIRNGAEYYSDEYAVIDKSGLVHPFPRDLSMRHVDRTDPKSRIPASRLGGKTGVDPINVGGVLFTEYRKGARWAPKTLTVGQGIVETIPHTIPVHSNTKFSLEVLNKAFKGAIIAKSFRGDAKHACPGILAFLDNYLN
jgi:hypothetical protein